MVPNANPARMNFGVSCTWQTRVGGVVALRQLKPQIAPARGFFEAP